MRGKKKVLKLGGTGYYCYSTYHCIEELEKQAKNFLVQGDLQHRKFPVELIH